MGDDGQHRHAIYERRTALVSNLLLQFWATILYFTAGALLSYGEFFSAHSLGLFGRSKKSMGTGMGHMGPVRWGVL